MMTDRQLTTTEKHSIRDARMPLITLDIFDIGSIIINIIIINSNSIIIIFVIGKKKQNKEITEIKGFRMLHIMFNTTFYQ